MDHIYLGHSRTVALLETVFRGLVAGAGVYVSQLRDQSAAPITLRDDVRLIDLRDGELARLGIDRTELVSSDAMHYPCTRVWATVMQQRKVGGHRVAGCVWNSRQADLYAATATDGLTHDVLQHTAVEVAVLWSPHLASGAVLGDGDARPLSTPAGQVSHLVVELSNLVGVPIFAERPAA